MFVANQYSAEALLIILDCKGCRPWSVALCLGLIGLWGRYARGFRAIWYKASINQTQLIVFYLLSQALKSLEARNAIEFLFRAGGPS